MVAKHLFYDILQEVSSDYGINILASGTKAGVQGRDNQQIVQVDNTIFSSEDDGPTSNDICIGGNTMFVDPPSDPIYRIENPNIRFDVVYRISLGDMVSVLYVTSDDAKDIPNVFRNVLGMVCIMFILVDVLTTSDDRLSGIEEPIPKVKEDGTSNPVDSSLFLDNILVDKGYGNHPS